MPGLRMDLISLSIDSNTYELSTQGQKTLACSGRRAVLTGAERLGSRTPGLAKAIAFAEGVGASGWLERARAIPRA